MQKVENKPLISIAPMLKDVTNTHFRYMMRLLSQKATLWTQMIHYNAIINNTKHSLQYDNIQHPIVLQLGGSNPKLLGEAALHAKEYGYDEINLNVGCPSPRVQQGSFGACLMKEKELVAECMKQIRQKVGNGIDCTVKCRLGVDEFDSYQFVKDFIEEVSVKGLVNHFIIHARKAYLKGLNPTQNRNIPPLKYDMVYKLIEEFPHLNFSINGGIKTLHQASKLLTDHPKLYGCMIGRTAYENPYQLVRTDQLIYGMEDKPIISRYEVLQKYASYIQIIQKEETHINGSVLVKPILNMFNGKRHSAKYRQMLSDNKKLKHQSIAQIIRDATQYMLKNLQNKKQEVVEDEEEYYQKHKININQ